MQRLLFIIFCFYFPFQSFCQTNIKKYVQQNQHAVRTIEPSDTEFADLESFGTAIDDNSIVMLGEQDHGDAPAFLAKTRLIKYLHEKKGFNVLAFEADFFGLNEGWAKIPKDSTSISKFLDENIFPIWTKCYACDDLFKNYVYQTYKTNKPLQISGIDNQMVFAYSSKNLYRELDSVLKSNQFPIVKEANYEAEILPSISSLQKMYSDGKADVAVFAKNIAFLTDIKKQADGRLIKESFWNIVIDNLFQLNQELKSSREALKKHRVDVATSRDFQMAENIKWLARIKYPNEKIIIWAHNEHISKNVQPAAVKIWGGSMGTFLSDDTALISKTYILGFGSYQGTAGRLGGKKYKVPKVRGGFESWMDLRNAYAFVDFKKYNAEGHEDEPFYMKGYMHTMFNKAPYNTVFDGVFFIRDMYSCLSNPKE